MLRVLTVHNHYGHYATSGEGFVFEAEAKLLESHGHRVRKCICTNSEVTDAGIFDKVRAFWYAPWSKTGYLRIKKEIEEFKPDIVHIHNFFLVFSPSILRAAKDAGVATVLTLHNYRLLSPCSQLLRKGWVCEKCLGKNPWRIMLYRCYRRSFWASLLRYRVYYLSKQKYNWLNDIDAFIALTQFAKDKFVEGNIPSDRIHVKTNFVQDPLDGQPPDPPGHGALFVGRLSPEKGLKTLIKAWKGIRYPLTIIGDGPSRKEVEEYDCENTTYLGMLPRKEVLAHMKRARVLVFPSEWYEGFPCVIAESFAVGLPVVASRLGAMKEIVDDGRTGLLFEPGNPDNLREKVRRLIDDPELASHLGRAARQEYLKRYNPERNYERLLTIYDNAVGRAMGQKSRTRCKLCKTGRPIYPIP